MQNRPIVVADDIGDQTEAGRRRSQSIRSAASFLASRLKAPIDLLYVEDAKTYPAAELGLFRFFEWHAGHEKLLEAAGRQFAVPASCSLKSGSPAEQILGRLGSRPAPELVVVGTQGRKGVERLLVGSVAEEVIRHARRPVVVLGPVAQERGLELSGRKKPQFLVPTDLGKNSRPAEHYALSFARRIGAGVTLFHCLWDNVHAIIVNAAYSGMAPYNLDAIIAETRDDAVDALKRKAAFFEKHGVACDYKIEQKQLLSRCAVYEESEGGYSFVVMGTHGRNAAVRAFFGSTARETILNAPAPVLIVHSGKPLRR